MGRPGRGGGGGRGEGGREERRKEGEGGAKEREREERGRVKKWKGGQVERMRMGENKEGYKQIPTQITNWRTQPHITTCKVGALSQFGTHPHSHQ